MMVGTEAERPYVIASLPRCGSTTLAKLVGLHHSKPCLIEPFHPRRYGGILAELASDPDGMEHLLSLLVRRYSGIKHVFESNGWPFRRQPHLNIRLVTSPSRRVILIRRRNLLQRAVSNYICRQTNYWIGDKQEFRQIVASTPLTLPPAENVVRQIQSDIDGFNRILHQAQASGAEVLSLDYEDLFGTDVGLPLQVERLNNIFSFLHRPRIAMEDLPPEWREQLSAAKNKWATVELYRSLPDAERLNEIAGSAETGYLFEE